MQFHAPTKALRSSGTVHIKQILRDEKFSDIKPINFANDFTATGLTKIAKSDNCSLFVIQGSQLTKVNKSTGELEPRVNVRLGTRTVDDSPRAGSCEFGNATAEAKKGSRHAGGFVAEWEKRREKTCGDMRSEPGVLDAQLWAIGTVAGGAKLSPQRNPIRGTVPDADSTVPDDVQLVLLPVNATKTTSAQVTLDKIAVQQGAKSVVLKGQHLELIALTGFVFTNFENQLVTTKISPDESSIEMTIPDAINGKPGKLRAELLAE